MAMSDIALDSSNATDPTESYINRTAVEILKAAFFEAGEVYISTASLHDTDGLIAELYTHLLSTSVFSRLPLKEDETDAAGHQSALMDYLHQSYEQAAIIFCFHALMSSSQPVYGCRYLGYAAEFLGNALREE